jgi:hypothetical protein
MVSKIYQQTHSIGILICNEHREQCQGEGEQFLWSLEYTDRHISSIYPYVNSEQCQGQGE